MRASTQCGARGRPHVCRGPGGRRGSAEVHSGAARPPIDDDATAARPGHRDGPSVGRRLGRTGRRRSVIDPDARMIWPTSTRPPSCPMFNFQDSRIPVYQHLRHGLSHRDSHPERARPPQLASGGTVALRDRWSCWIVGGGGVIQITSWSSSNAVASRNTDATSTPSS
jgi:hypothetical protein